MKNSVLVAALFGTLVLAHAHGGAHRHAHHHGRRDGDDDVVTVTSDVWVTETTTIQLPPGATIPAQSDQTDSTAAAAPSVDALSVAAAPAPAVTSAQSSAEHLPLPATSQQQPAAPTVAAAPQAPAPQAPAPQAPAPAPASSAAPASAPEVSKAAAPAPASSSSGGSDSSVSGGTSTHLTYYDATGYGSCGWELTNDSETVAMEPSMLQCGKQLKITGPGGTFTATAADKCPGCTDGHLDIPQNFAAKIVGSEAVMKQDGVVPITWQWI